MAVIAVLVAVAIPTFGNQLEKSRQATDVANLRDAYATAQLAILNQNDADSVLNTYLRNATTTSVYTFWYFNETLTATPDSATTASATSTIMGRARSNNLVVSLDGLPGKVTYNNLPTSGGANDKGIQVKFIFNAATGLFELDSVQFVPTSEAFTGAADTALIVTPLTFSKTVTEAADWNANDVPKFTVYYQGKVIPVKPSSDTTTDGYTIAGKAADDTTALGNAGLEVNSDTGALGAKSGGAANVTENTTLTFTLTLSYTPSGGSEVTQDVLFTVIVQDAG